MIFLALIQLIVAIPSIILDSFSILTGGASTVTVLPFGIDSILVQGVGYIYFLASVFPPISAVLTGFLFIIGFKILMKFVRLIPWFGRIF